MKKPRWYQLVFAGAALGVAMAIPITGLFLLGAVIFVSYAVFFSIVGYDQDILVNRSDLLGEVVTHAVVGAILSIIVVVVIGVVVTETDCLIREDCWRIYRNGGGEIQVPLWPRISVGALTGTVAALLWYHWTQ